MRGASDYPNRAVVEGTLGHLLVPLGSPNSLSVFPNRNSLRTQKCTFGRRVKKRLFHPEGVISRKAEISFRDPRTTI